MNVPSINECLRLMEQYAMLDNIREHSFVVARVAETILDNLHPPEKNGCTLPDRDLVRAGALLHDIAKTICLDGSCRHADEGMRICTEHKFPEIAQIVKEHVILSAFHRDRYRRGQFSAIELIYYSDKRVMHDTVVSLDERIAYIIDRYSSGNPEIIKRIRENFSLCVELETYLFQFLPFTTEALPHWVDCHPLAEA